MKLFKEYIKTLKMPEVEDLFDLAIFRPLGYLVMKIFYYTPATPNFITLISLAMGIAGGVLYAQPGSQVILIGSLFLALANVFDCADGQLARAKKNGTKFGRVFDGMVDYITYISAYVGMTYHLATTVGNQYIWPLKSGHWGWWIVAVIAGVSTAMQAILVDGARNDFMNYSKGVDVDFLEKEMAEFQEGYNKIKDKRGYYRQKILYKIYFSYLTVQIKTAKSSVSTGVDAKTYYKRNRVLMRLWLFVSSSSHLMYMIVCSLFNRFDLYLWSIICFFNIYAISIWSIQKFVNKRGAKKCRE